MMDQKQAARAVLMEVVNLLGAFKEEIVIVEGVMPDGAVNTVRARIVRPEAFILIKAFALAERMKEKDAYDVAFVLNNFRPALSALAQRVAPLVAHGLGADAFRILTEKYRTLDSVGPRWAAEVAAENGVDWEQARQAAFQDAQELFFETQRILRSD